MNDKNVYYAKKVREIAKQLEELRLEIYQNADRTLDDIGFTEHTDEMLFKAQSNLNYHIAEAVELLDYKD